MRRPSPPARAQALVAWISGYQETQVVEAARVGADGRVLDIDDIRLAGFDRSSSGPAVAWNGQTYLVAWSGFGQDARSRVLASEVDLGGALVGSAGGVLLDIPVWATQLRAASGRGGRSALLYDLVVTGLPIGAVRRGLLHFVDVTRTPVTGASVTIAGGAAAVRTPTVMSGHTCPSGGADGTRPTTAGGGRTSPTLRRSRGPSRA